MNFPTLPSSLQDRLFRHYLQGYLDLAQGKAEDKTDRNLRGLPATRQDDLFVAEKKQILGEEYGIEWRSMVDLNSNALLD